MEMITSSSMTTEPSMLACITFHYSPSRRGYVSRSIDGLPGISQKITICIVTNGKAHEADILN